MMDEERKRFERKRRLDRKVKPVGYFMDPRILEWATTTTIPTRRKRSTGWPALITLMQSFDITRADSFLIDRNVLRFLIQRKL